MEIFNLIATMGSGMESLVANELKEMGYSTETENGRVRFAGDISDIYRTNLWLRVADRIKIVVAEFEAKTFDDLFEKTKKIEWDKYIPYDGIFPVNGRSRNSILHSVPTVQAITKKAIATKLMDTYHSNYDLPETNNLYTIETAINKDKVMITLDTTGDSLFKRGYRIEKGEAPLKETMAAALCKLSHWFSDNPLVDPVTGSGTIPIEMALIAKNIAPGLNREFAISDWDWFDKTIGENLKNEARKMIDNDIKLDISGYDIDPNMIAIAKKNAEKAGVLSDINFEVLPLNEFKTEKINGIIIANPPYGQRLSDEESIKIIYEDMGYIYNKMPTWSKYILTSDELFEEYYGKKATKKRKLYNGALKVDLYQYWGKKIR